MKFLARKIPYFLSDFDYIRHISPYKVDKIENPEDRNLLTPVKENLSYYAILFTISKKNWNKVCQQNVFEWLRISRK
jgi:hypothetical protein